MIWHRNRKIFHIAKPCDQLSKRKLALKFNILVLFFSLITWHIWFFPKLLMKTNNLKWGVEFKIWHIYPLIWKSRFLLNPFFWSVFTCFSHLLTVFCLLSNINEIPAMVVWVITGMWANSDYTNAVAGEKSEQRASISLHILNTHTSLLKKKSFPPSGFLIIFYTFCFPFNIQNIHSLFGGVKKAYLVHIQNFGKASFFGHIWSEWYWKIFFPWGSCSFST